jgi:uncharacterized protein with HEPN domain
LKLYEPSHEAAEFRPGVNKLRRAEALSPRLLRPARYHAEGAAGRHPGSTRQDQVVHRGLSKQGFAGDDNTFDPVVCNLEVIGEAVKQLPADLRSREPGIDWQKIAGLQDILIHQYFGIDVDILWDITQNKLPALDVSVSTLLRK